MSLRSSTNARRFAVSSRDHVVRRLILVGVPTASRIGQVIVGIANAEERILILVVSGIFVK